MINTKGEPIPRDLVDRSGLFCAYNEGTTDVSITTGGLTYSEPVTVRGGSVEYPCGTVPLKNPPARVEPASSSLPAPSTPPSPAPVSPQVQVVTPSLPPPPPPLPPVVHRVAARPTPPVPHLAVLPLPLLALVPPPAPTLARPSPPTGAAPVTVPTTVAQHEEEEEGAIEEVHNMAAYEHPDRGPTPLWPLALIPIAAAAARGLRTRSRTPEPEYVRAVRR